MKPFQHLSPAFRTFVGENCLASLAAEIRRAGASRVVVFCGASLTRHPEALARVEQALGGAFAGRFDGVREHSPVPSVVDGARALRALGADGVVAVGGGSAVVTARASSILLAEGEDVRALCTQRAADGRMVSPKLTRPKLPQWVVATTPTTAYAKAGSAVRDPQDGARLALFDPRTRAQGLFIDPVLAATAPASLVASASLNAFAMAIEALESAVEDPLAIASLVQALQMTVELLPRIAAQPDDADARMGLMLAALLCGQGTDHAGGGLASVLGHAIGPRAGIANGVAQAIVLPHTMRFNASVTSARLPRIARAMGASAAQAAGDPPSRTIDAVAAFVGSMRLPAGLREVVTDPVILERVADDAMQDWFLQRNPRTADRTDVMAVLRAAW
jgi:alcohol dehydrogenase class IV